MMPNLNVNQSARSAAKTGPVTVTPTVITGSAGIPPWLLVALGGIVLLALFLLIRK
jgi:hypothetical protein